MAFNTVAQRLLSIQLKSPRAPTALKNARSATDEESNIGGEMFDSALDGVGR